MRLIVFSLTLVLITIEKAESISRADFPKGFIFGIASSAHQFKKEGKRFLSQFEGATDEGNKGDSIWDTFSRIPGRIVDFSNADMAVDQYH
ncbi:beta-glucosidase [Vigna unguiculata]|uniref:Beta-glucosidase n=1 Tax=Vigna unguiculata TaxID=3917 RepID=A0A4D6N8Y7_VIGUN|nr:beta-glucosidase [Vigna unguiculata]